MTEVVSAVPVPAAEPDEPAPSRSLEPSRPVFYGAVGSIGTYVAILLARRYGLDLPEYVTSAIPVVIYGVLAYVVAPSARQVALRLDDRIVQLAASMAQSRVSDRTVVLPPGSRVVPSGKEG